MIRAFGALAPFGPRGARDGLRPLHVLRSDRACRIVWFLGRKRESGGKTAALQIGRIENGDRFIAKI